MSAVGRFSVRVDGASSVLGVRPASVIAVASLLLLGDGGSLAPAAPAGPTQSHPPMTVQEVHRAIDHRRPVRVDRRLLAGLSRAFVADPTNARLGMRLVESARVSGRLDWLRQFAAALARRLPSAATLLVQAEIEYAEHGYARGLELARAAHAAAPELPEVTVSYAAALAGTGDLLRAFELLSPWATDPDRWGRLEEPALQRLAAIVAGVAPETLGELASTEWLHRSWRSREPAARLQSLAFAAWLADRQERGAFAAESVGEGLAYASRAAGVGAATALISATSIDSVGGPPVGRMDGVCALLPRSATDALRNCLASALHGAVAAGDFAAALKLYERAQSGHETQPLVTMRLASVALPLLEVTGAYREAAALAERATAAAARYGDVELESEYLIRLARARRLLGDYPGSHDAAAHAMEVIANESENENRWRAARELQAATLALVGERDRIPAVPVPHRPPYAGPPTGESGRSLYAVIDAVRRGESLESSGQRKAALRAYLQAMDRLAVVPGLAEADRIESTQRGDVWADVHRRALGLALREGESEVALALLERNRAVTAVVSVSRTIGSSWLPPRSVLVAYAVGLERPAAIVLRHGRRELIWLPTSTELLRDRVTLWRELAKTGVDSTRWVELGRSLAQTLLGPLAAAGLLDDADQLYVVPDDVLHLVPFATLASSDSASGRSRYLVTQAPSVATLRRALAAQPAEGPLLAFGVGGGTGMLEEMAAIRRAGGQILTGPRATEAEWRRRSRAVGALHFSGHAQASGRFDASAALRLTGGHGFDGLLTVAEVLSVRLAGSTVVLLGCDTATRSEQPGPASHYTSTPSLGEAFLHAGARAVVGNLWPITEEDASLLAGAFYRAGGPRRGALALEDARASLRTRFPELPRRWAGAVWLGASGAEEIEVISAELSAPAKR